MALFVLALGVRLLFWQATVDAEWPGSAYYKGDAWVWLDYATALEWDVPFELGIPLRPPGMAYLLAAVRGEFRNLDNPPWRRQLEPLGGIAVSLGLLGSVWAFTTAFGGFMGGIDIDRIVAGLGTAYTTTGVGLITAIIASLGSYGCDLLVRH